MKTLVKQSFVWKYEMLLMQRMLSRNKLVPLIHSLIFLSEMKIEQTGAASLAICQFLVALLFLHPPSYLFVYIKGNSLKEFKEMFSAIFCLCKKIISAWIDWLTDWLIDWSIDWLIDWLFYLLIVRLVFFSHFRTPAEYHFKEKTSPDLIKQFYALF